MILNKKAIAGLIALFCIGGAYIGSTNTNYLKDGVYRVEGTSYSVENYKPFAIVEVKNGRMIDAFLDYINKDGELLTKNKVIKHKFIKEKNSVPAAATREMRAEFLIKQDTKTFSTISADKEAANTFKTLLDNLIKERIIKGNKEVLTTKA